MADDPNIVRDAWLTGVLGRDAYNVVVDASWVENARARERLAEVQARSVFMCAKAATDRPADVRFLEDAGFRLIDTNIVFEKSIEPSPPPSGGCAVRWAVDQDAPSVTGLAGRSFEISRFHMDPDVPRATADRIKAAWAESYFAGERGDRMAVAEVDGTVVGFLLLLDDGSGPLIIDLIATDPGHRRSGVARALVAFAESSSGGPGRIRVGTQLANSASIGLYQDVGFRLVDSRYVFHYHHGQATGS